MALRTWSTEVPLTFPVNHQEAQGTVILFGWTNGALKHLQKGAAPYVERGWDLAIYHANDRAIFVPGIAREWTSGLVDWVKMRHLAYPTNTDTPNQRTPFVVHVFSNGGCMGFSSFLHNLSAQGLSLVQPTTIIFDSCPGFGSLWNMHLIWTANIKPRWRQWLYTVLIRLFTLLACPPYLLLLALRRQPSFRSVIGSLMTHPVVVNSPRIFLYSKADVLVPYQSIQRFIDITCKERDGVTEVLFEDTAHVQHWVDKRSKDLYWAPIFEQVKAEKAA